jgi:hypothetical protein
MEEDVVASSLVILLLLCLLPQRLVVLSIGMFGFVRVQDENGYRLRLATEPVFSP